MKGFGKALVALGVLAAGAAAALKLINRNKQNYTEVEFEDLTDKDEAASVELEGELEAEDSQDETCEEAEQPAE